MILMLNQLELGIESSKHDPLLQQDSFALSSHFDPSKVIQLTWHPRVFFYEKFLTDEDCDHLITLAQGKLEKLVVDASKGNSTASSLDISSGMFLPRGQDEVVSKIEERISTWTFLPKDATPDGASLHGSCMVLDGEMWTATKWIHVRDFNPSKHSIVSEGECTDEDAKCPQWAAIGECKRNPVYML
ncbi:prolyl 4-hydroxylase, partial [Musa troglodytarum]